MDHISKKNFQDIAVDAISSHPDNPRPKGAFKKNSPNMKELIASIAGQGILQPITVRMLPEDQGYQLIMGERRLTAARFAGLPTIPALVRDMTDEEAFAALMTSAWTTRAGT